MKNDLYIHIPTPCHEDWQKMTPETKGRFCSSCSKTVVDFSVMTDNDVLNFLNKNKGNLCGHFATDQLQRPIIETQLQPKRSFKYWLASVASLLVLMQKSVGQNTPHKNAIKGKSVLKIQNTPSVISGDIEIIEINKTIQLGEVVTFCQPEELKPTKAIILKKNIEGIIVDENQAPIAFASITTKNKMGIAATDSAGIFSLAVSNILDSVTLVISSIGYENKEVTLNPASNKIQTLQLKKKITILPEVTVVNYGLIRGKFTLGAISFYKKVTKIDTIPMVFAKVFKNEAFTIYPNPAPKNSTINLSIKEAGMYDVQVLNNQSKLLYSQQHVTESVKQVVQFAVPSSALPGLYYIRLINTVSHRQWIDKLIIQ